MRPRPTAVLMFFMGAMLLSSPAAAYLYNGLVWPEEMRPVPYWLGHSSDDLGPERTLELLQEAVGRWTEVPCSSFDMTYQGTTDLPLKADETNVITWIEEDWNWGSLVLGVTAYAVYDGVPIADIGFNGVDWTWEEGANSLAVGLGQVLYTGKADPAPVITHELGHFIGFSHSLQNSSATMYGGYLPGGVQATLSADDKLGLCRLYPNGTDECKSDADCTPGDTCTDYGDVAVCAEPYDDWGDPCGIEYINCFGLCIMKGNGTGYCSRGCDEDEDCAPEGWFCHTTTLTNGKETGLCAAGDDAHPELEDIVLFNPETATITEALPDIVEEPDTLAADGYETMEEESTSDVSADLSPSDIPPAEPQNDTATQPERSPSSSGCAVNSTPNSPLVLLLIALLLLAIKGAKPDNLPG